MKLDASVDINRPVEDVWNSITDFENCSKHIDGILDLEILEQPEDTLLGFKWKETRVMFGKEATETMWIVDYKPNSFYQTRAENNGAIYTSIMSVEPVGDQTRLTMSFSGEAQSFFAKMMSALMGFMMKGSMKKLILKDLNDIKTHLESA